MEDYENQEQKKERSPLYPIYSINETVDFIEKISNIGGKIMSLDFIAKSLNMSAKTNAFRSKISTAKQFGLLKVSKNSVELSSTARQFICSADEKEKKNILIEAFTSASIYNKLVERYKNQALPSEDKLSNILQFEYNFTKTGKEIAANKFIESAGQIGILKNGIIVMDFDESSNYDATDDAVVDDEDICLKGEETKNNSVDNSVSIANSYKDNDDYIFQIPTLSGLSVKIIIPKNVSLVDLDFITKYLQNVMPIFIKNLSNTLDSK